jgi:hypothetical protein
MQIVSWANVTVAMQTATRATSDKHLVFIVIPAIELVSEIGNTNLLRGY